MKILQRLSIVLLVMISFLTIALPVNAQQYTVKSYIVVPKNFNNEDTKRKIPQYQNNIIEALKDVQGWYGQKVSGKTFKFDSKIEVIEAPRAATKTTSSLDMNHELDGDNLISWDRGIVKIIWLVGSTDTSEWGGHGDDEGRAWLSEWMLKQVGSESVEIRNDARGILAHELGHAFGLAFSGYARAHSCSEISEDNCLDIAPKPLPHRSECANAIMCQGAWTYPNAVFNNSIYNPEQWKLYQTAFINPQKDPAPKPFEPARGKLKIDVFPAKMKVGEKVIIRVERGGDLGTSGEVFLKSPFSKKKVKNIVKWSNQEIEIIPDEEILEGSSGMPFIIMEVHTQKGIAESTQILGLENLNTKKPSLLTANFSIKCEKEGMFPPTQVELGLIKEGSQDETQIASAILNEQGESSFFVSDAATGTYVVRPRSIENHYPEPSVSAFTITKDNADLTYNFVFVYTDCSGQSPTISPTPTQLELESNPNPTPTPIAEDQGFLFGFFERAREFVTGEEVLDEPEEEEPKSPSITTVEPNIEDNVSEPPPEQTLPQETPVEETPPSPNETPAGEPEKIDTNENLLEADAPPSSNLLPLEITSIILSNYEDFRGVSVPGDNGSVGQTFFPTQEIQHTDWILSTLLPNSPIYIRKFFNNQTYEDSQLSLSNGQSAQVGYINIQAKTIREVVDILINGQSVDINDPSLGLHLDGTEGQAQDFTVSILVTYTDGSVEGGDIAIHYRPDVPPEEGALVTPETGQGQDTAPAPQPDGGQVDQPVSGGDPAVYVEPESESYVDPNPYIEPAPEPEPQPLCDSHAYYDENTDECIYKYPTEGYPDCGYQYESIDRGYCGL